ncbi:hypothetical protein ISCGN_013661 [Ixodes scapularis]
MVWASLSGGTWETAGLGMGQRGWTLRGVMCNGAKFREEWLFNALCYQILTLQICDQALYDSVVELAGFVHLGHSVLVQKYKLSYVRGARGDSIFVKDATKLIFGREDMHGPNVKGAMTALQGRRGQEGPESSQVGSSQQCLQRVHMEASSRGLSREEDSSVGLHPNIRLAVLSTHHKAIVNRLLRITSITLQNTSPPVHSYLAAPNNSCLGAMHGIAFGATPDEIINDLEFYQADIFHARRMGTTGTAVITFIGTHVPYTVYYRRLEFRCRPYKPRAHHCNSRLEYGHLTLACPGNQRCCPTCSTILAHPDEPHPCTPWFALLQLAV